MPYQVVAVIFFLFLMAYLVEVSSLVRALKRNGMWSEIGSPDLFSPVGQSRFFSVVMGRDQAAFHRLEDGLKRRSKRIQIYMLLGLLCFVLLVVILIRS